MTAHLISKMDRNAREIFVVLVALCESRPFLTYAIPGVQDWKRIKNVPVTAYSCIQRLRCGGTTIIRCSNQNQLLVGKPAHWRSRRAPQKQSDPPPKVQESGLRNTKLEIVFMRKVYSVNQ